MVMQRVVKPKTRKGKLALVQRSPKIIENNKFTMVVKGSHSSEYVNTALTEWYGMKKPDAILFSRKHDTRPFEDETVIEKLCKKYDASLFLFGSHNKKRPNNLIIGRMFDHQVLDMFELGAENYKGFAVFHHKPPCQGNKPCMIFNGSDWDTNPIYKRLQNLLTDYFRGPVVKNISPIGVESALTFTLSSDGIIYMRQFGIKLMKSGQRTPRVELEEIGPSCNLVLRRHKLASDALFKLTLKKPRSVEPKKKKNVSHDAFGSKLGRVHMKKQDMGKLGLRKVKALKKDKKAKANKSTSQSAASADAQ